MEARRQRCPPHGVAPGRARMTDIGAGPHQSRTRSFTLVELLIVILIIGILAAVAIPQFGDSSTEAKIAALDQNLAVVRKAIQIYHQQHNGCYPGRVVATHELIALPLGTKVVHVDVLDAFTKQLTCYSNANGHTSAKKHPDFPFGPYLRKGMPENPLPADTAAGAAASVTVVADTRPLKADNSPATGWKTSYETGEFIANHPDYESR